MLESSRKDISCSRRWSSQSSDLLDWIVHLRCAWQNEVLFGYPFGSLLSSALLACPVSIIPKSNERQCACRYRPNGTSPRGIPLLLRPMAYWTRSLQTRQGLCMLHQRNICWSHSVHCYRPVCLVVPVLHTRRGLQYDRRSPLSGPGDE